MIEFLKAFGAGLSGIPSIFQILGGSGFGSLVICMIKVNNLKKEQRDRGNILRTFLVGWIGGAFLSPIGTALVTAIFKVPEITGSFVAGGSGYWAMDEYLAKKQKELLDKKTPDDGDKEI